MLANNFTNQTRLEALLVFGAVVVAIFFLNFIPLLFTPFRRLATLIHELGHAFATRMSGGEVDGIIVYPKPQPDGTLGEATRTGGDALTVLPAGYLGTTVFSAGLILLSSLPYIAPYTLAFVGILLIALGFMFGLSSFTRFLGLAFGILFIGVAWLAELIWSVFLLNLVALQLGVMAMYSLQELKQVVHNPSNKGGDDASKMAGLFKKWPLLRSPVFWANTWTLLSILILAAAIWFTWFRGISAGTT